MVSQERLKDYLGRTEEALKKIIISPPEKSHLRPIAEDFIRMARCYYDDAIHFFDQGKLDDSFACVNYAHGWLDAGARLGLYDTGGDDRLFTLAE